MNLSVITLLIILNFPNCSSEKNNINKDKVFNACIIYGSYCYIMYGSVSKREQYNQCMDGRDGDIQILPAFLPSCGLYSEYIKIKKN